MRNNYLKAAFVFGLCGLLTGVEAQTFQKTFGGSNNDSGRDFEFTPDGGYIIAGQTLSSGAGWNDIYLVKTDASGNKVWEKTLGGSGDDYAYSIIKAHDGGYIIGGSTRSAGAGSDDFYLVKINESGDKVWDKTFGGSGVDFGREVAHTNDGGYIFIGYTQVSGNNYDMMVVKTGSDGSEKWRKTYGGGQFENGYSVKATDDGGYILLGTTYSYGNGSGDAWLVKINGSGTIEWNKWFGGTSEEEGQYVEKTPDGGYIIVYDAWSNSMGDFDMGVTKVTSQGSEDWTKLIGDTEKDVVKMVKVTADGGYIISGITRSFGLINPDFWLVKLDQGGNELWKRTHGGINHEHCYATKETADGHFVAVGHTQSWGAGMDDVWFIKVTSQGVLDVPESAAALTYFNVYPNPTTDRFTIESKGQDRNCYLRVTALNGQLLKNMEIKNLTRETIDLNGLSKGIYFLHVSSESGEQTTKLVID